MEGSEIKQDPIEVAGTSGKKKIFVAGATGNTGKRIVEQLLAKGFAVKAGVRDLDKAKTSFPGNNPDLQIVSLVFSCQLLFLLVLSFINDLARRYIL